MNHGNNALLGVIGLALLCALFLDGQPNALTLVTLAGLAYVCYAGFAWVRPATPGHYAALMNYATGLLAFSCGALAVYYLLDVNDVDVPVLLSAALVASWTGLLILLLKKAGWRSRLANAVGLVIILAPVLLGLVHTNGVAGFLTDVDHFAQGHLSVPLQTDTGSRRPVAPSTIAKAAYGFLSAFLLLGYYGRMWGIRYRYKKTRQEKSDVPLDDRTLDQVVLVLATSASLWVAFVMLGQDSLSISVFSGLVALAISVAMRDLLNNFLSGLVLLWDGSIKHDDVIAFRGKYGYIDKIGMRFVSVRDRNDQNFLIPYSSLINETIENWTRDDRHVRLKLNVGVSYESDREKAKELMVAACLESPSVLKRPLPAVLVTSLDDSAINLQLRFRVKDPKHGIRNVMSQVYDGILDRFDKEPDIEVPFPQRELRMRVPNKPDPAAHTTGVALELSRAGRWPRVTAWRP